MSDVTGSRSLSRPVAAAPPPADISATMPAGRVLVVMLTALLVAGFLNSEAMVGAARALPDGPTKTVLLGVTRPIDWIARHTFLDAPRHRIDAALGREQVPGPARRAVPQVPPAGSPGAGASPTSEPTPAVRLRDASAAAPLSLFITGDSMIESFAPRLINRADDTGAVKGTYEVKHGTGMVRDDVLDWPVHAAAVVAARRPEAIIVMMGGNDGQNIDLGADGILQAGSAEWQAEYELRARRMMAALTADGRKVYWVGMPIARSAKLTPRFRSANAAVAAAARATPGVTFVDIWTTFADANGRYADYLPDASGRKVLMRNRDGIHLSRAGAAVLVDKVFPLLDRDWKLSG